MVRCRIGVFENDDQPWRGVNPKWDEMLLEWTESFELPVRVVGPDEPIIQLVSDETLADAIRQSLRIDAIRISSGLQGQAFTTSMIEAVTPPVDLAFSIILRPRDGDMAGAEIETGQGAVATHQRRPIHVGRAIEQLPLDTTAVEIVLRTNENAAEADFDVRGPIWDGELVIENVPVIFEDGE